MKARRRAFFPCLVVLLAPATALADTIVQHGETPKEPSASSADHQTPRLRLDVAGNLTLAVANPPLHYPGPGGAYPSSLSGVAGGAGVAVDLGVQAGDRAAVYARAQASGFGGALFASEAAAYAVAEWTPRPWVSLGTGAGYERIAPTPACHAMAPCGSDYPHWNGVSVPLLVGFHLFEFGDPNRVHRAALRLGLEGAAGFQPSTEAFGWHMALSLGAAWM